MKESIDTIPINDAFDAPCFCPLCTIEQKLEDEFVELAVGASVMEPDFRIVTNEKGFCKQHYAALAKQKKALPLSLMIQTHSQTQNQLLSNAMNQTAQTKGLFRKTEDLKEIAKNVVAHLHLLQNSCAICEKLENHMNRYTKNTLYFWKKDAAFREKFNQRDGFCLPHFALLLEHGTKVLSDKEFAAFYQTLTQMQLKAMDQAHQNVTEFTKLFDYQSKDNGSDSVRNAIKQAIALYAGGKPEQ